MAILTPPPSFDLNYYKATHPELQIFGDNIAAEHCRRFAVEQGHSTCFYDRSEVLKKTLQEAVDKYSLHVLELSPWDNPFLTGANVKYFAVTDAETLKKTAVEESRPFANTPEKIHFVSPTGDLGVVDETFDIVFSSHVIEHTPDLVRHFPAIRRILNRGGLYILIVPDKRYCFDHFNAETTIADVLDAFVSERKTARLADFISTSFTRAHNYGFPHWFGDHGNRCGYRNEPPDDSLVKLLGESSHEDRATLLRLIEKYNDSLKRGEYVDAHNWRFTPDSFGYIVDMLNKLNFIDMPLYRLCHTVWATELLIKI